MERIPPGHGQPFQSAREQAMAERRPCDAAYALIVRTIIAVAHELHMTVAAEGVAEVAQAALAGCDELEEFCLGAALCAIEAERRLDVARTCR